MKNLSLICSGLLLVCAVSVVRGQESKTKKLKAGMTGNFSPNFVKTADSYFTPSPFNHDLSVGMIFNTSFASNPNLGVSTGFEFEFTKLNYTGTSDSVFYRYAGANILHQDELGGTAYYLTDRQFNTVGLAVPLMMLFRMDPIGDWTIFGKFGVRNSVMVSQRINDRGFEADANGIFNVAKENANMKSFGDQFFYKGSVGFSAGAEWNFAGSTSLVPEIGFYYGLTPLHFRAIQDNYTLSNASGEYFYQKARQNQLIIKLSILF
ncbi:MAG: hypothetical protein ACKO4K_09695 [Flavobacteriales bacterium]